MTVKSLVILTELNDWLNQKVNDKNIHQEERIVYSKVLDKLEDLLEKLK